LVFTSGGGSSQPERLPPPPPGEEVAERVVDPELKADSNKYFYNRNLVSNRVLVVEYLKHDF
jgi:hypothetical protein